MPAGVAHTLASLRSCPNSLARHYARFRVAETLRLTGHSHQAWPDVARDALVQAFDDAAARVDGKWERAFAMAERVRAGYRRLLDDPDGHITLGASTHELLVRFLSALPLRQRPRLVTTDGEFHTVRRQLGRLAEEGVEIVRVPLAPVATVAERLVGALAEDRDRTAAVIVSTVSFLDAHVVPHLPELHAACQRAGAALLLDAYHHLNVVPFYVRAGLENAYVTGGGYKYCQLGEGNAFLRTPRDTTLRPIVTGWFAEFGLVARPATTAGPTAYPDGPDRFAGATYDPASHYRAAAVFDFFTDQGLDIALLREVSQHQTARLAAGITALDLADRVTVNAAIPAESRAGFVALRTAQADALIAALAARGVAADARGEVVRLGPAPYLCDAQLDAAIAAFGEAVRELGA